MTRYNVCEIITALVAMKAVDVIKGSRPDGADDDYSINGFGEEVAGVLAILIKGVTV